ncbi:MAG: DUF5916 domain-containing protein [Thermoanaerobaculales bacterium]|jgi:hypothetical protein|nr:DUF5916 domain-containing protein [Thermoanaerobaculales bacterium]
MKIDTAHATLLVFVGLFVTGVTAADMPTFSVTGIDAPVRIDGVLDEPAWNGAAVIPLDYEYQPGDNIPAVVATDVLITFDHDYIYVAFRAEDPEPGKIRAHLMDRDQIDTLIQDDHVVVMIDTFNDERRGFQFRVNPLGVQADAIFSETDGLEDFSWDLIWDSAGRITDFGYVIEIALPLKQLRFPRTSDAQTWGFDLARSYPRNVRHRFSAVPKDRNSSCALCQVAKVTGFVGLQPGRNLEIDPTLTATRTDAVDPDGAGELEKGDTEVEFGITGSWGITPNITLSAAVNPDFSQVEADAAQLEVNERFALFYPEQRPFFLVGVDLFSTPVQAVFTRTVVDPSWGVKLTGKEGRHGIGLFVTSDDVNQILIPSNQGTRFAGIDGTSETVVGRYRLDVGTGSTIGGLITAREGVDYHNRVAGVDGYLRFSRSNTLRFQAVASDTRYPTEIAETFDQDHDAFTGHAVEARFRHQSRNWFGQLNYEEYSPGFRADAGFIPRVDTRMATALGQRTFWGERNDWYTNINVGAFVSRTENHDGELTDEFYQLFGAVNGPWQSRIGIDASRYGELFGGVYYDDLDLFGVDVAFQPNGSLRIAFNAVAGDAIDYANNQPGDIFELNPGVELKLGRRVNATLDYTMRQLDVEGGRLFRADLSQLRLVYHFNVRTMLRGTFQYYDIDSDPELYTGSFQPEPEERTLYSEVLFSYTLNPQTVIYVGVSENQLGVTGMELTETDRTYFIKLGYAWLL